LQRFLAIGGELLHRVARDQQYFLRGEARYAIMVVAFRNEDFVKGVEFPKKKMKWE
jgi:hypothetical protein